MRVDGTALSSIDIVKKSKRCSNVSSKALNFVSFMDFLRAVIVYSITFYEIYTVPFQEALLMDIKRDIMSANFIPGVQENTHNQYIHADRFCQFCPQLLDLILDLKSRSPTNLEDEKGYEGATSVG